MDESASEERWGVAQVTIYPTNGASFVSMIGAPNADDNILQELAQKMAREGRPSYSVVVNFTLTGLSRDAYDAVQRLLRYGRGRTFTRDDFTAEIAAVEIRVGAA